MANIKISELTALAPPAAADELVVVDVSATTTKKTTVGEVVSIITGDVEVANDGTATISELPVSKLQDGAARQLLQTDAAGTGVEWTSNVALPGTLSAGGDVNFDSGLIRTIASTNSIGLFGATPAVQPSAIANITTTATTGTLPTANGSVTIADAAAPTVSELLEYSVELEAKLEAALAALRTLGVIAT
jgi:hypothetical protein